ncbi:hypothetical protein DICPUDRAFT_148493 [Dictyostelium purpureum]|uniref:SPIN90/Ldb17 leucine-rich domain-containing protein n=1 Tax=Dictyostelium purpureum TaxID=5786 RepID=F0ZB96_DICPU|nr:uncharacterized protein DICPUDRAFT_148493 [Dictyostelium purpureum]EGC38803.1 hypothetical protein DICPUDRAFT_148493 [Dictyostelium purpureum]|eukprot:XP_003284697.1 hypothetical protein DICPUDRAFT_148493 [Dictyostelium purpureum]
MSNSSEIDNDFIIVMQEEKTTLDKIEKLINKESLSIDDIHQLIEEIQQLDFEIALKTISNNDYQFIKLLCNEAKKSIDFKLVTEIIKFINVIAKEDNKIIEILVDLESFNWIIPNCFIVEETESSDYLETLILIFSNGDKKPLPQSELQKLDDTFLDSLLELALNYKDYYETKYIHLLYYTMFGYQKNIISDGYSPLICKLYSNKQAPELGPEMIALLNRAQLEYGLLPQCLSLINDLFCYSQDYNVPCFFYTLDIKVLIDIIIREIHNLDELDPTRWQFLEVLSTIIDHDEYENTYVESNSYSFNINKNSNASTVDIFYKISDIKNVLNQLQDERSKEKDPRSSMIATTILKKLNKLLSRI